VTWGRAPADELEALAQLDRHSVNTAKKNKAGCEALFVDSILKRLASREQPTTDN
jgi:hypothetical protein